MMIQVQAKDPTTRLGENILAAIINGGLMRFAVDDTGDIIVVWSANAAEQIGCIALNED